MINDGKFVVQIKYEQDNKLVAMFSNVERNVLVKEILFEK